MRIISMMITMCIFLYMISWGVTCLCQCVFVFEPCWKDCSVCVCVLLFAFVSVWVFVCLWWLCVCGVYVFLTCAKKARVLQDLQPSSRPRWLSAKWVWQISAQGSHPKKNWLNLMREISILEFLSCHSGVEVGWKDALKSLFLGRLPSPSRRVPCTVWSSLMPCSEDCWRF